MAMPTPRPSESAYLGFTLVNVLLDTLVEKGILSTGERKVLVRQAIQILNDGGEIIQQRGAKFLSNWIASQK
jgi:hypothetical protein